jgi:hypothetical protein
VSVTLAAAQVSLRLVSQAEISNLYHRNARGVRGPRCAVPHQGPASVRTS